MIVRISEQQIEPVDARWLLVYAIDDGQLIGSCQVVGMRSDCPVLQYLFVEPAHRRKGVGTALIKASIGHITAANKMALTLTVDKKNPEAEKLYRRLGFKVSNDDDDRRWMSLPIESGASS